MKSRERNRMIRETKTLIQTGRQRKKEPKSSRERDTLKRRKH